MAEVDASELIEYVRGRLPVRSRLVGRERLRDLVLMAVAEWPIDQVLDAIKRNEDDRPALARTEASVRRTFEAVHGSGVLLALILPALVSAIVQLVLRWWLERQDRRWQLASWQYELKGGVR